PETTHRTILTAIAAALPVLCWIILIGHPLAAALGFLVSTAVTGQIRDQHQRHKASASQRTSSELEEPPTANADDAEPAPIPQPS
ncbi:hypothetical protein KDL01_41515, partial [Actinospica durhamensis]